jgi:hypothetical protein
VLYNPELELFWYSDAERLWVIDTHNPDVSSCCTGTPGQCGPYLFNHGNDAFLVADVVGSIGRNCVTLEGRGAGWLEPGGSVGNE